MLVTFGVDPGLTGAISVLADGRLEDVIDMPAAAGVGGVSGNRVQPAMISDHLSDWLRRWDCDQCTAVIELVSAMPKQGVHSMFSLGHSLGVVETAFACSGVRVEFVTPGRWKAAMGLGKDKAASRALAARLFPTEAGRFRRVRDDGRSEAVLIAHWWLTHGRTRSAGE